MPISVLFSNLTILLPIKCTIYLKLRELVNGKRMASLMRAFRKSDTREAIPLQNIKNKLGSKTVPSKTIVYFQEVIFSLQLLQQYTNHYLFSCVDHTTFLLYRAQT